ncbi:pyridoxal phosphate-dependent transferase [Sphaerosporella brunnea]|uniref:Pyridoxal phosphate-dependent transferase n=1 Tax=Sphaerosporella brunnea TaxID=1250544 RepID=A0A5J5ER05_9PEZI|nr:pyridoxal phosphate-dependent transferase [Sphaerosporella brunnea]
MDANQFRAAAHAAIDQVIDYYENISDHRVVSNVAPGYLRQLLPTEIPENGEPWDDIQKDITEKIIPGITHWQSPNFLAFFPANSTYPGILGELYSAAFTSANFNWLCSPAATELETIVLDWLCQLISLPPAYLSSSPSGGGGVIQGSASEAIVTVVVAARDRALRALSAGITDEAEKERFVDATRGKLVALCSDQSHSSTQKGCLIAGTKYRAVKVQRDLSNQNFGLKASTLRLALEAATAEGLVPFYTTVTLGTTSTCAVDDFAEIAQVAKDYPNLWIHVDAAYAGAALVCPEYKHLIAGVEAFDSFNVNMHKWLLTNFDCSCLFVKERKHLLNALSITPSYLRNEFSEKGLVTDYRDWQIPLGRRFRALKAWFVMRTYGAEGLRKHIRNCVAVGTGFYERVKARPDLFTIFTPPAFGLTVFTVNVERQGLKGRNEVTKEVYESVNADGEVFITSTVVDGNYAIRIVSGNPRIEDKHLARAFDIIVAKTEEVKKRDAHTPPIVEIQKELKGL